MQDDGKVFLENIIINFLDDVCVFLYFSGIIGFLKGVMLIYDNIVVNVQ